MIDFIGYIRNKMKLVSSSGGKQGSTIDELATKPVSSVLVDFYNMLVEQKTINNVENWREMTESQFDDFGAKFFVERFKGSVGSTMLRIRLNQDTAFEITDSARAYSDTNVEFKFTYSGKIEKSNIKKSGDVYSLYYVDLPVVSITSGVASNVPAGSISRLEGVTFDFSSVSNQLAIINGSKHETNEEYYYRLKYVISTRSLMTKAGIYAFLKDYFPTISNSYVAGAGDKYMERDYATANVDSDEYQLLEYKGKIPKDSSVQHYAASYIYPPRPSTNIGSLWGQLSSKSKYSYPLSVFPITGDFKITGKEDAAFFGYDYTNEFDSVQYSGLYFNDYNKSTVIKTKDLLNIRDETIQHYGKEVISPNKDWVVGSDDSKNGDFGEMHTVNSGDAITPSDVLSFESNVIKLGTGAKSTITAGKFTNKRVGLKTTGELSFDFDGSDDYRYKANINVIAAGTDDQEVDSFNGVGFGVMFYTPDNDGNNAVVYFTHSNRFSSTNVYIHSIDTNADSMLTSINSVKEEKFNIKTDQKYNFEFAIADDLTVTLVMTDTEGNDPAIKLGMSSRVLNAFAESSEGGILSDDTEFYGSTVKVSLNSEIENIGNYWMIKNLKVVDLNVGRPTILNEFDVSGIDTDLELSLRAYAKGASNGVVTEGFTTYIWDNNRVTTVRPEKYSNPDGSNDADGNDVVNTIGGWVKLPGVSSSNGLKDSATGLLTEAVSSIGKYIVDSGYGDKIYIMTVASGTSSANLSYYGSHLVDMNATLSVDYIKMNTLGYNKYHTRNKADVYVVTDRNAEPVASVVNNVAYNGSFIEMTSDNGFITPINSIIGVSTVDGNGNTIQLSTSDYSVYSSNELLNNSVYEDKRLVIASGTPYSNVNIEYTPYTNVRDIQDEFDSNMHDKVYGDIMAKHKYPVHVTFNVTFSGSLLEDDVLSLIWNYIDDRCSSVLSISDMLRYLYGVDGINNINENVTISYTRTLNDGGEITGATTSKYNLLSVEYFSATNLTVTKV